jgi:hypothetical protein
MAEEVGERTVKLDCRCYRRFLTWAAASPGISGRSLAALAAIAHHVDSQGEAYGLPADFTKASDTHSAAFVPKWGDVSVELDALPIEVLRERIVGEVERSMDLTTLEMVRAAEDEERRHLVQALGAIAGRT